MSNERDIMRDYMSVFNSASGERVLKHMIDSFNVFRPVTASGEPELSAYQDGQRSVVLDIMHHCDLDITKISLFGIGLMKKEPELFNINVEEYQPGDT